MANIEQLLQNGGSQTLVLLSIEDLAEFGRAIAERTLTNQPKQTIEEDEMLTAREIREKYKVSRVTIWRMEKNGLLASCGKVGNRALYSKREIERVIRHGA